MSDPTQPKKDRETCLVSPEYKTRVLTRLSIEFDKHASQEEHLLYEVCEELKKSGYGFNGNVSEPYFQHLLYQHMWNVVNKRNNEDTQEFPFIFSGPKTDKENPSRGFARVFPLYLVHEMQEHLKDYMHQESDVKFVVEEWHGFVKELEHELFVAVKQDVEREKKERKQQQEHGRWLRWVGSARDDILVLRQRLEASQAEVARLSKALQESTTLDRNTGTNSDDKMTE